MTLNEVLARQNFINKLVLKNGENELPKELKVKLMGMRIKLNKIRNQHDEDSKEAVKGLKPDNFDELYQKEDKTEEEIATLDAMHAKLIEEHNAFLIEKGKEEVEFEGSFTEDEFNEIMYVNSDDVEINGTPLNGADFLEIIYTLFVE